MNVALWIVQILLALAFLMAGINHGFRYDAIKDNPMMKWITAIPQRLRTFIGVAEILGAIGLVLPALTGILPWLTPLAAVGLVIMMVLAAAFHARRGENQAIVVNTILLALAAFVAYGRWSLAPL